ncbi:phototropic-responsive NPH3 family protein NPY1-like [Bidens hawaiensis]|uniref:phototropic-responsive NPH3 family protein NPY1-like n=1 Tax=Bidens hawaiensis TaxID=980011 RepID=UPI0040499EF0
MAYDVELVQDLVDRFFDRKSVEDEKNDLILVNPQRCKIIGHLIDGYLAEIACDRNVPLSVFTKLSRSIPDAARLVHDGIYGAVDVYLNEHPTLTKVEKKQLCELIDVKKLSSHASAHAAQNDRLPLRTVVQILFHEQVRATTAMKDAAVARTNRVQEQDWGIKMPLRSKSLRTPSRVRLNDGDVKEVATGGSMRLLPSSSRRFLNRFWVVGKGHGESKSTGTSGSSQSKSSSSSSRKQQRYSIS